MKNSSQFWSRCLACIGASLVSLSATAGAESLAIAEYFNAPERVRYGVERSIVDLADTNPQAAQAVLRSLKYMRRDEVLTKAAGIFDNGMSADDAREFSAFMVTPLGKRVGETFRTHMDPQALNRALEAYPEADQPELKRVFSQRAAANVVAALNGKEWQDTWRAYGEVLMCRYLEKEKPKGLANARRQGKCLPSA